MKDAREKALEKARQRTEGVNAESDRERLKQARRAEMNSFSGENVHKIPAMDSTAGSDRILRVAAYGRVSTGDLEQVSSMELQKDNYPEMIRNNPKWVFAGMYVDNGYSGTNTEHRHGFNMMMEDAMAGKFDMIITKSVSRFARNLIDCINWIRRLQKLDPPVAIKFEQEGINTLESTSNIIIFVLAMVAEEESHMKSEAMLLSLEWRFSRGIFLTPKLLGYDKVERIDKDGIKKKMLVINEEQAPIVRYMYYSLLNGLSTTEIAENLTAMGLETGGKRRSDKKPNTTWSSSGVTSVLRNERYCGDVLARKTWTPDFHDHKSKKNNGNKNKYYHPGHHEAIVTRAQWNAAQKILNSGCKGYSAMQVVEDGILCGFVSVNRKWAGADLNEYYRITNIVMGLDDGELETDLGSLFLPEGGYGLAGTLNDNGVQKIARDLLDEEREYLAKKGLDENLNEIKPEKAAPQKTKKSISAAFQVITGDFFTHANEPALSLTRNTLAFNTTCVKKFSTDFVEILFNPVLRMLAVRPCSADHPNRVPWRSKGFGATKFCDMLFEMLEWDKDTRYKIHPAVRSNNGETVLLFDLDNSITPYVQENFDFSFLDAQDDFTDDRKEDSEFYVSGDVDSKPRTREDIELLKKELAERAEIDSVTFGTPVKEYVPGRMDELDSKSEWNISAQARVIDSDHRVNSDILQKIEDELLNRSISKEG